MKKNVAGTAVSVRNFGKKSPDLGQGFYPEVIMNQRKFENSYRIYLMLNLVW